MKKQLLEQAISRVEEITSVKRESFNRRHERFASDIYESLSVSKSNLETDSILSGFCITEKSGDMAINRAVESIKADPLFSKLEDRDVEDLVRYFVDQNAGSIVFAPDVLRSFIEFCRQTGFPSTYGGVEKGGLHSERYNTSTLLRVLIGAHVLTVTEVPAVDARDANHSSEEDTSFRENPKIKVDVYEYDQGFLKELGHVLRILGVKEESIRHKTFLSQLNEKKEIEMKPTHKYEALEQRLNSLLEVSEKKKDDKTDEEEPGDEVQATKASDEHGEHESEYFKDITDDKVEKFVDGLLIVLGELEQTGEINKIESPDEARDAVLAAVRRMYQKRGLIARMSRQYTRFGSKRVLRKAKQDIGKALS